MSKVVTNNRFLVDKKQRLFVIECVVSKEFYRRLLSDGESPDGGEAKM